MEKISLSDVDTTASQTHILYNIGPLYALASTGKIKSWKALIHENSDASATIVYTFGYLNGTQQVQNRPVLEGKNIGKSNETTPFEQACKDADSKADKKRDKGYQEDINTLSTPILPMLALPFEKRKHNIVWPAMAQPKIDGVRCTCRLNEEGKLEMFTRKGKQFTALPHIEKELMIFLQDKTGSIAFPNDSSFYLDGELYSDSLTFQQLAGTVRREKNDSSITDQIYYIIFDCFYTNKDVNFRDRWGLLKTKFDLNPNPYTKYIKLIDTILVTTEDQLKEKHNEYVAEGYEGIIVRNLDGLYKLNHRSADLQKLKSFQDDEYTIIDFKEGEGIEQGCVVWQCETGKGSQRFWVRPTGSRRERTLHFNNGNHYLGQQLTVRFQELTDDGIPRFPVGISIRNYE